jgi:hypothetical protein
VNPVPKLEEEEVLYKLKISPDFVGGSCIRWQLVPVPDGLGEERITEGLTACSFLIKAIFASSPAVLGLDILVAVTLRKVFAEP